MLDNDRIIKAAKFLHLAGIYDEQKIKYLGKEIRDKLLLPQGHFEKAKMMKEMIDSFVEMYIWKDRRFQRD